MTRSKEEWIQECQKRQGFFVHDGNPKRPHPVLTSGLHSNGFFNSRPIIADEKLMIDCASDLFELFGQNEGSTLIDGVVGPQTGGEELATLLSLLVERDTNRKCFSAAPVECSPDGFKRMLFTTMEGICGCTGGTVLLCDDVLTTGENVSLAQHAVEELEGNTLPYVLVLANRSGLQEVDGKKIISLVEHFIPTWEPYECEKYGPCSSGSRAIPAKDNWEKFFKI